MVIAKVLVEMANHSLDKTFDYLGPDYLQVGTRVTINFNHRLIIGYVLQVERIDCEIEILEKKLGYKLGSITEVIDSKPLLNKELQDLSITLSKLTLAPRIACLQAMLPPQLKPASLKTVGIKYERYIEVVSELKAKTVKQNELLEYLKANPKSLVKDIPFTKGVLDKLVDQGLVVIKEEEAFRDPFYQEIQENKITLQPRQEEVVSKITKQLNTYFTGLIHGVTGSGKTEVYLSLSKEVIKQNKTVIMLVPEISLTPMMVKVFKQRFGHDVAILHSRLSQGERYDEYRRIRDRQVKIVVGARSAVFAPLDNIGLIIMDEEHDSSYKQESTPRYLTSQIARIRAQNHKCPLILGSATPSLETYSRALKGVYQLYELPERINKKPLPKIEVVDMGQEIRKGNYSLFSKTFKQRLQTTLDNNNQAIILLNKRGYASFIRCNDCGEVIKCPHCDVTLTYHKETNQLKCHYCDYQRYLPGTCPTCNNSFLKLVGYGTQKVAEELEKQFNTKIIRYDIDSTRTKNAHQKLLTAFEKQEAGILLGTQMIAKGLDFENVTFVAVLNADLSLNIPDFRSNERTFQLLMQVAGRSGRGKKEGSVLIQTFNPKHFVLKAIKNNSYLEFYQQELQLRKLANYPPYKHLVSILIEGKDQEQVIKSSIKIKDYLKEYLEINQVLGPADALIYKMHDYYRRRILIKFIDGKKLYPVLEQLTNYYNMQGRKVRVVCDFNPYSQI